jgi:hypothetical protein
MTAPTESTRPLVLTDLEQEAQLSPVMLGTIMFDTQLPIRSSQQLLTENELAVIVLDLPSYSSLLGA